MQKQTCKKILISLCALFAASTANAQLKIGDNPTAIEKSSLLELEGDRQGLLLPRLSDTTNINTLNPPDGMVIYFIPSKSLLLRSNHSWKKIADLSVTASSWSLTGTTGSDSTTNFLGTTDGQPVIFKTNNSERLHISSNGNIGIGTATPAAALDVNGSVKFGAIGNDTTLVEVLVLAADGSLKKRTISSASFHNAIKGINGIQKQELTIKAGASASTDTIAVVNSASDSSISINIPVQDGTAGSSKPYGLLTYADWQKLQSGMQTLKAGAVATTADAKGITIDSTATTRTIILHPADVTNPGIISADTQTLGGDKTFAGKTTLKGGLVMNNITNNASADSVLVINNGQIEKRKLSVSAFSNAIRKMNGNTDTAQVISFKNSGTDLTVSANGTDSIFLNVPDAATGARGVVSTGAQTFGGNKTFNDSVAAAKTMAVGTTSSANSTLQVNGSVAMAIKTVTADYTAAAGDNTILANTSSASINVTLPATSAIAGRIYTIKKVGTGGIDRELTITPTSATIDGGGSFKIYNDWTFVCLQTDGANWYIIKK